MVSQNSEIFKIVSIISWVMLAITGWMSFGVPDFEINYYFSKYKVWIFWTYGIINSNDLISASPLVIYYVLFY